MALVSVIASSMFLTGLIARVGPKVSSVISVDFSDTWVRIVGWTNRSPTTSTPPTTTLAPRAMASSMWLLMTASCEGIVDRADLVVRARVQILGLLADLGDEGVETFSVHVDPLGADAGLAGVGHTSPERSLGRGGQVGVLVDDQRVLAAGLDEHRCEVFRARGHHLLAGRAGAGEGELVHGCGAQRVAGHAETGDDLEHRATAHHFGELVGEPLPDAGGVSLGLNTTALPAARA